MIQTAYVYYRLRGQPVVIGIDRSGELTELHVNGVDFTNDGQMEHEVTTALKESGVNLQEDISKAFEKALCVANAAKVFVS